mmetsp:Transcript_14638/g.20071  ORF Transcript_14638/g.20071 Transcript_14638/m.20071 type:complete len:341 (-) Transcript_14638:189-1211(-)
MEASMVSVLVPMVTFLRQITPDPVDINCILATHSVQYPVGCKVFYLSVCDGGSQIHPGVVVANHGNYYVDIAQEPNLLLDTHVPIAAIRYTAAPLVSFQSLADLARRSYDTADRADWSLSTAHLLSCLHFTMSLSTAQRLCIPQRSQDNDHVDAAGKHVKGPAGVELGSVGPAQALSLQLLAGQLSWLIVHNISHHAHAPLGREQSMIHQLRDVSQSLRRDSKQQSILSPQHSQSSSHNPKRGNKSDESSSGNTSNAVDNAVGMSGVYWMDGSEWQAFVEWMDRWIEDLIGRLGGNVEVSVPVAPQLMSPSDLTSPPGSLRKRRMGLRSKIDWVQSPEDL